MALRCVVTMNSDFCSSTNKAHIIKNGINILMAKFLKNKVKIEFH